MPSERTTALVTGASAGIGAEFCRQLASRCEVIIATGRRRERLQALAGELAGRVEVHPVAADLVSREGLTRVIETLRQKGPADYLINNAGFGVIGPYADGEPRLQEDMVSLHVGATMELTRAALPFMLENGAGYIVNVSSLASFNPPARCAVYSASKVFLNHFSEALQLEVGDAGIKVQSLCPGYTRSEFHDRETAGAMDTSRVPEDMWMEAGEVVEFSLRALEGDAVVVVPGEANRAIARRGLEARLSRLGR